MGHIPWDLHRPILEGPIWDIDGPTHQWVDPGLSLVGPIRDLHGQVQIRFTWANNVGLTRGLHGPVLMGFTWANHVGPTRDSHGPDLMGFTRARLCGS